jgi:hypothetical protein
MIGTNGLPMSFALRKVGETLKKPSTSKWYLYNGDYKNTSLAVKSTAVVLSIILVATMWGVTIALRPEESGSMFSKAVVLMIVVIVTEYLLYKRITLRYEADVHLPVIDVGVKNPFV